MKLPPLVDSVRLVSDLGSPPKDLVHGVLNQGAKGVLGGASKSRKTWMLANLAFSVAYGIPWLDVPTSQGPVLLLNLELQAYFYGFRLREIAAARGIKFHPDVFHVWNLRGYATSYDIFFEAITEKTAAGNYALVILDPMYKLLGNAVENDSTDVAAMLNRVERFTNDTKASVFFAAHFPKGNMAERESIDRISGSGVFARDPDTIITMTNHKEKDCYTIDFTLRNHPPIDSFVTRWHYPLMERAPELNPVELKEPKGPGREPTYDAMDLLSILPSSGFRFTDWLKAAEEKLGVSKATFKRKLDLLRESGSVENLDGVWTPVTLEGVLRNGSCAKNGVSR